MTTLWFMQQIGGSSPRVRGTLRIGAWNADLQRFIPARAGNAIPAKPELTQMAVHPRACGERWVANLPSVESIGSSPRARGTPVQLAEDGVARRFIPARAGNAQGPAARIASAAVHPRACGERPA